LEHDSELELTPWKVNRQDLRSEDGRSKVEDSVSDLRWERSLIAAAMAIGSRVEIRSFQSTIFRPKAKRSKDHDLPPSTFHLHAEGLQGLKMLRIFPLCAKADP